MKRKRGRPPLPRAEAGTLLQVDVVIPKGFLTRHLCRFEPGEYLESGDLADVKVIASDGVVMAHRLLLGATCPALREAFLANLPAEVAGEEVVLSVPDFTVEEVNSLLKIIYGVEEHEMNSVRCRDLAVTLGCEWIKSIGTKVGQKVAANRVKSPKMDVTIKPKTEDGLDVKPRMPTRKPSQKLSNLVPDLEFKRAKLLDEDMEIDLDKDRVLCPVIDCSYSCLDKAFLKNHVDQIHRSVVCVECGATMLKNKLPWHMISVHPPKKDIVGDVQFKILDENSEEGEESARITTQGLKIDAQHRFLCPTLTCHFTHKDIKKMLIHVAAHKQVVCQLCGKLVAKRTLETHMRRTHKSSSQPSVGDQQCDLCQKSFADTTTLGKHKRSMHGVSSGPCSCRHCGKSCVHATSLKIHERTCGKRATVERRRPHASYHSSQKAKKTRLEHADFDSVVVPKDFADPHKCAKCKFRSTNAMKLKEHWVLKHEMKTCTYCGKDYAFNYIDQHVATVHTKSLDYECEVCHKKFFMENYLVNHRDEEHIKELKFKCELCATSFYSQYRLTRHKLRYHKERNFPCKRCDKIYLNRESLKKHCRKVHGQDIPKVKGGVDAEEVRASSGGTAAIQLKTRTVDSSDHEVTTVEISGDTIVQTVGADGEPTRAIIQHIPLSEVVSSETEGIQSIQVQQVGSSATSDGNYVTQTYTLTI